MLYPLLAITLVLLFSSLSLALVVLLRNPRILAANARSKEAKRDWECVVQLCKEDSPPAQCSGGRNELPTRASSSGVIVFIVLQGILASPPVTTCRTIPAPLRPACASTVSLI